MGARKTANVKEPAVVYWIDDKLYLNLTNQCSNDCWFCFRNYKKGVNGFNLKLKRDPSASEIKTELEKALSTRSWSEVIFCGFGEPTVRLSLLLEIAGWIKSKIPGIPVRLNTNGHGYALNLHRDVAAELAAAGVTRVSVSLNGFDEVTYIENCRPKISQGFNQVLEFVKKAKAAKLSVEVSTIRLPEVDVERICKIVEDLGVAFRVRDYIACFW